MAADVYGLGTPAIILHYLPPGGTPVVVSDDSSEDSMLPEMDQGHWAGETKRSCLMDMLCDHHGEATQPLTYYVANPPRFEITVVRAQAPYPIPFPPLPPCSPLTPVLQKSTPSRDTALPPRHCCPATDRHLPQHRRHRHRQAVRAG